MTPETDDLIPPWEVPEAVRRDCEPHRATTLYAMAMAGYVLNILACVVVPAVAGLPLCTAAWILARRDLQAMALGKMDSSGAEATEKAKTTAALGIFVAFLWFVPLLTCVGLAVIGSIDSPHD